jgi:hypothetical protein
MINPPRIKIQKGVFIQDPFCILADKTAKPICLRQTLRIFS